MSLIILSTDSPARSNIQAYSNNNKQGSPARALCTRTHSLSEYLACISVCCLLSVVKAAGVLPWQSKQFTKWIWMRWIQLVYWTSVYSPVLTQATLSNYIAMTTHSHDSEEKRFQKPSSQTRVQDPSHPPTPSKKEVQQGTNKMDDMLILDFTYSIIYNSISYSYCNRCNPCIFV